VRMWTGFILLTIGTSGHGNEPSGFIKGWEFIDNLRYNQLLKKESTAWP
jgi:hypothetical protein